MTQKPFLSDLFMKHVVIWITMPSSLVVNNLLQLESDASFEFLTRFLLLADLSEDKVKKCSRKSPVALFPNKQICIVRRKAAQPLINVRFFVTTWYWIHPGLKFTCKPKRHFSCFYAIMQLTYLHTSFIISSRLFWSFVAKKTNKKPTMNKTKEQMQTESAQRLCAQFTQLCRESVSSASSGFDN